MSLEEEIERLLRQRHASVPWLLEVSTGEKDPESFGSLTDLDFIKGLRIQVKALNEAVILLAKAIDELSE